MIRGLSHHTLRGKLSLTTPTRYATIDVARVVSVTVDRTYLEIVYEDPHLTYSVVPVVGTVFGASLIPIFEPTQTLRMTYSTEKEARLDQEEILLKRSRLVTTVQRLLGLPIESPPLC